MHERLHRDNLSRELASHRTANPVVDELPEPSRVE